MVHAGRCLFFIKYTGNICEVLIFARRTNLQMQESRENYFYNSATKEKYKFKKNSTCKILPDSQYFDM